MAGTYAARRRIPSGGDIDGPRPRTRRRRLRRTPSRRPRKTRASRSSGAPAPAPRQWHWFLRRENSMRFILPTNRCDALHAWANRGRTGAGLAKGEPARPRRCGGYGNRAPLAKFCVSTRATLEGMSERDDGGRDKKEDIVLLHQPGRAGRRDPRGPQARRDHRAGRAAPHARKVSPSTAMSCASRDAEEHERLFECESSSPPGADRGHGGGRRARAQASSRTRDRRASPRNAYRGGWDVIFGTSAPARTTLRTRAGASGLGAALLLAACSEVAPGDPIVPRGRLPRDPARRVFGAQRRNLAPRDDVRRRGCSSRSSPRRTTPVTGR